MTIVENIDITTELPLFVQFKILHYFKIVYSTIIIDENKDIGVVIGIDLLPITPIDGAILLSKCDFTEESTQDTIQQHLQHRKVDVVLSDMAPNASGVKQMDHGAIVKLCFSVLKFSVNHLKQGGTMVCKLWNGSEQEKLENTLSKFFSVVKPVKPVASRSESAEMFLLCKNFHFENAKNKTNWVWICDEIILTRLKIWWYV